MNIFQVVLEGNLNNSVEKFNISYIDQVYNYIYWVFYIFIGIFVIYLILKLIQLYIKTHWIVPEKYHEIILKVQLPKVSKSSDQKSDEKTLQQIQEEISVMETFFAAIGGLKPEKGFKTWLFGRNDDISFEIVLLEGKIMFFISVPKYLRSFLEQQIHGQFPEAFIEEVLDYNIFSPQGVVVGGYLVFRREYLFPIKTYKNLQSDPLNAILNTFNKFDKDEGAAIQILARSAKKKWHNWGIQAVSKMHQGKTMKQAVAMTNPKLLNKLFWEIKDLFKSAKTNEQAQQTEEIHKLSSMEEEAAKGIEEKASKAGLDVNIRIIVSSKTKAKAELRLNDIINSFSQFNIYEYGNSFQPKTGVKIKKVVYDFIHRKFDESSLIVMNTEELASIYHFPLPSTVAPNIDWLSAKMAPAPLNIPKEGIILGKNVYRGKETIIRIKQKDRRRHMYIIGMTGVGKSVLAEGLAIQDILAGRGVCFIDPHGDAIDTILEHIPRERADDLILFDPANVERPMGMNMLEYETQEQKLFIIDTILQIFDKLYDLRATGGPMFEQYMRNSLLLIMDDPTTGMTLADVPKVLADEDYRRMKLSRCKTPVVKHFWVKEAEKAGGEASLQNMVPYITSKLTPFIANDLMRPIISQERSSFSFRQAMDTKKIILVKLSKGKIGDLNANLLGMIVINKILMAALGRANVPEEEREDFYLYIDEFQNFLTDSIEIILSEARKYKLNLIIAHQYLGQLVKNNDTKFRDAIFGNVGTKIAFRIGVDDAEMLAKEFAPVFTEYDFLNVPKYNCFCKLLIDNANPPPFNMQTFYFDTFAKRDPELGKAIAELSLLKYCKARDEIEKLLQRRDELINELIEAQKKELQKIQKPQIPQGPFF